VQSKIQMCKPKTGPISRAVQKLDSFAHLICMADLKDQMASNSLATWFTRKSTS